MPKDKDHDRTRTERVYARASTPGADLLFKVFTALLVPFMVGFFVWVWNIDRNVLVILQHQENAAKFWILHGWEKDQIDRLRIKHNLDISTWPPLPGRSHNGH